MKKLPHNVLEGYAAQLRAKAGLNQTEPIHTKTLLRTLGILAFYQAMSEDSYGLSVRSNDGTKRFMLINAANSRGRQHFTMGHELFHLYFDEEPRPHICSKMGYKEPSEKNADEFASVLLMPEMGIRAHVSSEEIRRQRVSMATCLRLEQLYGVSHQSMAYRLRGLKLISDNELQRQLTVKITDETRLYGYDTSLYEPGNAGLSIGDFGEKAKRLFDEERISEGHYIELLNLLR